MANEDYLKINKVGMPVEAVSPIQNYSTTGTSPIMDPENNPSTPNRTGKTSETGSFKVPVFNPQYLTGVNSSDSDTIKGFNALKGMATGVGTNDMAFGAITQSIHQKGHIGNIGFNGAATRDVVQADGSFITEEIVRGSKMFELA